jgi:hypothetical protein
MSKQIPMQEVSGIECRHVVYCPPFEHGEPDYHLVKEIIHKKDGTTAPNIRMIKDYERPFWVTKQGFRNHQQKKEWERKERLNEFSSRQCDLIHKASVALGNPRFKGSMRKLANSPYLYGADILSTAVLKQGYINKWPELNTPHSNCAFDIETDVVHGTGDPIIIAQAYGNKVVTVIKKSFVEGLVNVVPKLREMLDQYLGDVVKKRGIEWEIQFEDDTVDVIKTSFKQIHAWQPDFLSIWNIDFDIPRIEETLKKYGVSPADVFSDPSVQPEYRFFRYKQGPSQKKTESGKMMPIKPASRWHTAYAPASFYMLDAMCCYRHIRNQMAEEQSYSLDAILNKEIKRGKLYIEGITDVTEGTLEWHQEMQQKFPLQYIIYSFYDVVGMLELDDKIADLKLTVPMFSGASDFENFKSQPRRMVDELHYYVLNHRADDAPEGLVIATTGDEMMHEYDNLTPSNAGWIVMLAQHLVHDNGLQIIKHAPWLRTNFRGHTGDLDVSAAYPTNEEVMNISKETTSKELCSIDGVTDYIRRHEGINLSGGQTNAVEVGSMLFGLPTLDTLLVAFEEHIAEAA